jgi:hypothetical protein
MNPSFRSATLVLSSLGSALMLSSCAASRMALPPTLSKEAKRMPVEKTYAFWIFGLEKLAFGGYKVTDYKTGWQSGSAMGLNSGDVGYAADKNAQKYEFRLTGPSGKTWKGLCAEAASKRTLSGNVLGGTMSADLERQATLDCDFQQDQGAKPWKLALALQKKGEGMLAKEILAGSVSGALADSAKTISVIGTHDLEGTAMGNGEMSGFSFQDGTKEVGAVQVINESTVWMDPTAEAELGEPMALASAALMLQQGLLKKLDDKEKK